MRILAIDDDHFILRLLRHQLERQGLEVVICPSPEQGLEELLSPHTAVDLLFCDIQMPSMDGVELIRHLAKCKYSGGVVLLSGQDDRILNSTQRLARAHGLNVWGALQKPLSHEQLVATLAQTSSLSAPCESTSKPQYSAKELQRAIRQGELVNFYQPKVSLGTGELVGVESLVRWQHPQDGLVFPDQFIPTAETHGLIDDLTRIVLVLALNQAAQWQQRGFKLNVAVNISMSNLHDVSFPDYVAQCAKELKVDLSRLTLEVTETQLMQNPETVLDILIRMRLKNVTLSIDDFGTGHSSLRQLYEIPFNELKVDAGFVHGAFRDRTRQVILEASLAMAHQLGMPSVYEGVEVEEDWRFLVSQGCGGLAQGYFIAKPMPADQLPEWHAEWRARYQKLHQ